MTALVLAASASNILVWIIWILAALALLASGLAVVLFQNPFFSALALIGNLASLAVIMFVFVLAYLGGRADAPWAGGPTLQNVTAVAAAAAIALEIAVVIALKAGDSLNDTATISSSFGSPAEIGELFLSDHLLAFEVTSIVLLVAAVGGVILGSAMPTSDEESEA